MNAANVYSPDTSMVFCRFMKKEPSVHNPRLSTQICAKTGAKCIGKNKCDKRWLVSGREWHRIQKKRAAGEWDDNAVPTFLFRDKVDGVMRVYAEAIDPAFIVDLDTMTRFKYGDYRDLLPALQDFTQLGGAIVKAPKDQCVLDNLFQSSGYFVQYFKELKDSFVRRLVSMDDLANSCGYFRSIEENNGYGCSHPKSDGGGCSRCSCPIACPATYNDMLEMDPELAEEYSYQMDKGKDADESLDSDWMVQHAK